MSNAEATISYETTSVEVKISDNYYRASIELTDGSPNIEIVETSGAITQ